jgi:hypothetical protein
MGIWRRDVKPEVSASIRIVSSAYASVIGDKAYLSMPITTGKRYYDTLDRYGVRSLDELEKKYPGALRGEILLPNLETGKALAEQIAPEIDASLICPGIFDAREQAWTQDEYMALWLDLISSSITEIYLSDGWEYSNGGAIELAQALLIHHNFVEGRDDALPIYDHKRQRVNLVWGAQKLIDAIKDLERRGYSAKLLREQLSEIVGIAGFFADPMTSRHEIAACRAYRLDGGCLAVLESAHHIGVH